MYWIFHGNGIRERAVFLLGYLIKTAQWIKHSISNPMQPFHKCQRRKLVCGCVRFKTHTSYCNLHTPVSQLTLFLHLNYVRVHIRFNYLQVDVVSSEIQMFAQKHEGRLHHHENAEAIQLLDNTCIVRRLQRKKNFWAGLSDSVNAESVLVQVLM
jgi:hypothetical protein